MLYVCQLFFSTEPCPRNGFVITFERQVEQLEDNPVSSPNQMIPKNKVIDFTFSNVLAGKYFSE